MELHEGFEGRSPSQAKPMVEPTDDGYLKSGSTMSPRLVWTIFTLALVGSIVVGLIEDSLSPWAISPSAFSTINITTEILRTTCAISLFGVVWLTRGLRLDRRSLVIGMSFLAVGVFTILRLLTFPNMPSLGGQNEDINHSLYLSEFLRYTVGVGLLLSALGIKEVQVSRGETQRGLMVTFAFVAIVTAVVLVPGSPLPNLQIEGAELHHGFMILEVGAMVISYLAAFAYARIASRKGDTRYVLVSIGLILFAQAGFSFMKNPDSENLMFLIGRATALVGFFFVFLAIMRTSLQYPYLKLDAARKDFLETKILAEQKTEEMRILAQDLTERRLVEAALRESERNYRDMVETATEGIWKTDANFRTTFVNNQLAEMLGYLPVEILGRKMDEFVEPDAREAFRQHMERRRKGFSERYEITFMTKDGERIHALVSAKSTRNELGEFSGSHSFITDITERKEAEDALRESERTLFGLLVDLPVGIVVSDPNGRYLFSNDRAVEILGKPADSSIPPDQTTGFYNAYVVGTDQPYPQERAPIKRALKGERSYVDDVEIRKPNERVQVEIFGAPVTNQDGDVIYALAAFQDITERKRSEKLITDLNKSLELNSKRLADINRELETFSYSVSHDLRAPLRTIDGFSSILAEHYAGVLDDKGKDYLKRVRAGCERMGQLIDDILKLSRITRDEITWERVDLSDVARSVLADLRKAQPDRSVKTTVADGMVVHGDSRLYRILMTNLLENAWKFCQKQSRPTIEFGATVINGERVFFVRDNGAGFDMRHSDKLFVPFQRLHTSTEFAGTGIGLATAQRIVHRHGGKIWAEAEVDKGATFYFTEGRRSTRSESQMQLVM